MIFLAPFYSKDYFHHYILISMRPTGVSAGVCFKRAWDLRITFSSRDFTAMNPCGRQTIGIEPANVAQATCSPLRLLVAEPSV
jgi:hypothetical protein